MDSGIPQLPAATVRSIWPKPPIARRDITSGTLRRQAIASVRHLSQRLRGWKNRRPMPDAGPSFVRQLTPADADALIAVVRRRAIAKSEHLLHAGAAGDEVMLVLSGRVKLIAYGNDRREVVIGIRGPGELIGEMAALGAQRRTATAVALDDVEVGLLSAAQLREFLDTRPGAERALTRVFIRRLTDADRARVDLATQDSVGRIAARLLALADDYGISVKDGTRIELPLTQDELASWTGATRETVSRALTMMRRLGWVASESRRITVLDRDALRKRSGGP
jgi:CRP-like cAMP-binding protein